jgi:two-component system sporulation sensor kinase A
MVKSDLETPIQVVACLNEKETIRVLHVDDEALFLSVAQECLKMEGPFEVDTALSVDEALNKMKEKEYDAVVSDYQMPGKDGLEFLRQLRKKGNGIPFIIFTGRGREEVAIKALNYGADRYLNKTGDSGTVYCELAHAIRQAVDRMSAQSESLKREAKLNAILESSPEAITVTSLDGNIVECNQTTVDMHGYQSKEDLVGKSSLGLIAEKDREKARQNMKKTIEQESVKNVEYILLTEDGREFPAELSASVVRGASGEPEWLVAITRDITERKKAEETLRETKEYLDNLLNYANAPIIVWNNKQKISLFNTAFAALTGYSKESMLGRELDALFPPLQKTEILQTIERATRGEKWQSVEVPILCKDEKTRIALWNSANIQDRDGNIVATIAQGQDITERKKAEAELRRLATIVTDSNDAITVVDMEGRITAWNKGAEDTYGYRKDEALGMDVLKIVPEDKKQETLDVIGKIKTNETMQSFETKRLTKDGRILDVWLTATKLVDDKGNAVALATTERDITEKKRLEEKLRFSEKFTTLGQLAASVAHEIRNPLGVIKNSVYFLNIRLKEHADEKVVKHLRIMEENINAADRIISDLLDLSRNKVGALELADLNGILERAFASLSIPENIKVITKLDKIPKMLLDPERIKRVFLNIIQNAVAAMPKGGKLTVGTSRSGDSVEISFKDSGEGIPEENMQKLFTPLFTTKAKGLGMGLSICKQIIEGHRGDIVVKSKAGEGALFIVRLPILSRAELVKTGLLQADVLTGEMSK